MDKGRWQNIFDLFEQALDRQPEDRERFLDEVCAGDETLRRGVDELLQAHGADDDLLDRPIAGRPVAGRPIAGRPVAGRPAENGSGHDGSGPARAVDETPTEPRTPTEADPDRDPSLPYDTVGPYRLLRRIGQGGMSTVYAAARTDDAFRRPMVLKLVRADMENAALLRRLRAERQILAGLEHPYIARLYDGGSTDDGMPYFVMEHVEGLPIDAYCRHNRLTLDQRLTLFRKVCEAVHYAHQNLVVHRDIKPSNILVTADGDPKLLDFGIAKVLHPGLGSSDIEITAPWQRLMTPSFASPEQIRGDSITTLSDVYSLGVLLFYLLTGRLPRDFSGCTLREIERLLTDTEPPKPSHAVHDPHLPTPSSAFAPGTGDTDEPRAPDPEPDAELPPQALAGDVDAVVLKALRSVPNRRYGSVERLAEDIERFQTGFPVRARAGTWSYRAGKFLHRHRRGVTAASVTMLLIVGSSIAALVQAHRVAVERDKKARVVQLIQEIFELSDPYVVPGTELTVREALERSLPMIEESLWDQPEVRADLLHTTGSILTTLGVYERAKAQLEEALELRIQRFGDDHLEVAETQRVLAEAHRGLFELDRAQVLAEQALEVSRRHLGPGHPDLARPLLELVSVYCYKEHYDPAEPLAEEALALTRELPGERPLQIAALQYLTQVHSSRGDYATAVELNREALELSRSHFGDRYPAQIVTLSNLGVQLRRTSRFEEAKKVYAEAIELRRESFGEEHEIPALFNNLAGVLFASGDYAEAEAHYRHALKLVERQRSDATWMHLSLGLRIARSRAQQGAVAEAEQQVRDLIAQKMVAEDHWLHGEALGVLGETISLQDRCAEAEPFLVDGYRHVLAHNRRARVREDAFARLKEHLERCGKADEIPGYESQLTVE